MSNIRPLSGPSLVHQVREYIQSYVIENGLRAGDSLPPETEFARQLGVSRNSVREAVKSLESMGIVEVRRGNGLYLRPFSFDPLVASLPYGLLHDGKPLAELLEVRRVLEVGMIDRVVAEQSSVHMQAVASALESMRSHAEREHAARDADREFHRALFSVLGNDMFLQVLDVFWLAVSKVTEHVQLERTDPMRTYRAHLEIAEAVRARDVERARTAMADHYTDIARRLERHIPRPPTGTAP